MPAFCFPKGPEVRFWFLAPTLLFAPLLLGSVPGNAQSAKTADGDPLYRPAPATIVATPLAVAIAGFDRDRDLVVTRAEFDEQVRSSFARGDSDGDGFIGLIELSSWAEATLGHATALPGRFDFDRDGDDRISSAEFEAEFARRFAALDRNRDSRLTRSELVTLVALPGDPRRRGREGDERRRQRR